MFTVSGERGSLGDAHGIAALRILHNERQFSGLYVIHTHVHVFQDLHVRLTHEFFVQKYFENLARTKVKKSRANLSVPAQPQTASADKIRRRHAGVLGLCACVRAFPYDVPPLMPRVLMDLSTHVNDPQPIQVSGASHFLRQE